jgi:hypothetical protein
MRLGFLINFNEARLKDGITRAVNNLEGKQFFGKPSPASRPSRDPEP